MRRRKIEELLVPLRPTGDERGLKGTTKAATHTCESRPGLVKKLAPAATESIVVVVVVDRPTKGGTGKGERLTNRTMKRTLL